MNIWAKVHQVYSQEGMSGVLNRVGRKISVRRRRKPMKPTKFPLKPSFKQRVEQSLAKSSSHGVGGIKNKPGKFPSLEDLYSLWPILILQQRLLHERNRGDTCFNTEVTTMNLKRGRKVQKNLFEIWTFLHEDPPIILEIGSRTGFSLLNKLAFHSCPDKATVFCLDLYVELGSPRIIKRNLQQMAIPTDNVFFITGDSKQTLPSLMKEFPQMLFDYVLVDGSHQKEDAYQDLCNVIPYINSGGYLVFDDTGPSEYEDDYNLIDVWKKAIQPYEKDFDTKHYDEPYGFCVARKKDFNDKE